MALIASVALWTALVPFTPLIFITRSTNRKSTHMTSHKQLPIFHVSNLIATNSTRSFRRSLPGRRSLMLQRDIKHARKTNMEHVSTLKIMLCNMKWRKRRILKHNIPHWSHARNENSNWWSSQPWSLRPWQGKKLRSGWGRVQ